MSAPSFIVGVPVLAIVAIAMFSDLRDRRIPNGLSIGGAALGLLVNAVTFGPVGALLAAIGWALCVACFMPLYVSGGTAAGDVKLMGTVGAFLGPVNGFIATLLALVAGASIASLCQAWRWLMAVRSRRQPILAGAHAAPAPAFLQTLDKIPYATAIAVGAAAAVLQPDWVAALFK